MKGMAVVLLFAMAWITFHSTSHAIDDKTGPDALRNANIVRWARGEYEYRSLRDKTPRGNETFYLTVHADGSRTMRAFPNIAVRDIQSNVMLHVDASFRPISGYMTYFTQGRPKGALAIFVNGNDLRAISLSREGIQEHTESVPDQFSLVLHPLALDGWHPWYIARSPDVEQTGTEFLVETNPETPAPLRGQVIPQSFVYRGKEKLSVPAGTFDTEHITMAGHSDIWFTGPDRILVRYIWKDLDREYVLRTFETGE